MGLSSLQTVNGPLSGVVYDRSSVTSLQANIGCVGIMDDQYTAGGILWVNGGPPQDAPPNTMDVPCVPSYDA